MLFYIQTSLNKAVRYKEKVICFSSEQEAMQFAQMLQQRMIAEASMTDLAMMFEAMQCQYYVQPKPDSFSEDMIVMFENIKNL